MSGPWEQYAQQPDFGAHLDAEAQRLGVPVQMARAVMRQESGGRADAVSPKGARGPMQLMPGTAAELGVDPNDPYQNITGGLTYLKQQMDTFGDPQLALAAYNAGPGAVRKYGGVPPYAETQNYVQAIAGPAQAEGPWSQYGDAPAEPMQVEATMAQAVQAPQAAPTQRPQPVRNLPVSQGVGFARGLNQPIQKAQDFLDKVPGADVLGFGSGPNILERLTGTDMRQEAQAGKDAWLAGLQERFTPGKIGEFAGNVLGTLPTAALPGGVIPQGMAGGALLSEAQDAGGVVRDAAIGGLTSAGAAIGLGAAGDLISKGLSKAPKVMNMEALQKAYQAAYKAVDDSGFRFRPAEAQSLATSVERLIRDKGGPKAAKLFPYADGLAAQLKALASQRGGLPLTQLDELRSTIYETMVKPGGSEQVLGRQIRQKIDDLISKEAAQNATLRQARDFYTRFSKARTVMTKLESADLQAGRAYTGKNVNNAIRQKLSPLIDPASGQRIKNATPDEAKALKRAVVGSPGQNLVRTAGSLLDPRGVLGMGLQATGAAKTAGLTLASIPLGLAATAAGNRMSQKNVQDLVKLIAAGGSKQALAKVPTRASKAVQKTVEAVRPALPAGVVALLPRPQPVKKGDRR